MKAGTFKPLLVALYVVSLGVVLYFLVVGSSYYLTPLIERPRHEDFFALKPGGEQGRALGIAGSALMVVMLVYSIRKRAPWLRRFGQVRLWLHFHIFCGIVGPLLVILHSSFKVQGLVALSFWSMIVVALSGVVGRYLYVQIPRRRSGDDLSLNAVRVLNEQLSQRLVEEFNLSEEVLAELNQVSVSGLDKNRGLVRLLLGLPWESLALRWRLARFRSRLRDSPRSLLGELMRVVRQKALLERRIRLWDELQRLFFYWHLFHKPFAVIMYVFMVVHIAVAVVSGYGGFGG
ncbi:MAG: hypothetical protein GY769_25870 [bacterium]|nr:hypothetical protein [bacterium]